MRFLVSAIETDRDKSILAGSEILRQFGCAQDTICFDNEPQVFFSYDVEKLCDLRVEQRLAAGELHAGEAQGPRLMNNRCEKLFWQGRVALASRLELRRNPAVAARKVATLGEVKVDGVQSKTLLDWFEWFI